MCDVLRLVGLPPVPVQLEANEQTGEPIIRTQEVGATLRWRKSFFEALRLEALRT